MNVVIDSNVLFSALIKDSKTRRIILEYEEYFLFPSYIYYEVEKHKDEILEKSGMKRADFDKLFGLLMKKVLVVPNDTTKPFREEAYEIARNIDIDDTPFIACALAYSDSILWSDDKKLQNQSKINVLNTQEFIEYLKRK